MAPTTSDLQNAVLEDRIKLFNNVKEQIRCSGCNFLPRPFEKIYRCICGKTRCSECGVCCTMMAKDCKGAVSYPQPMPDPLYSQLLEEQLPFECKNTEFGCQQILMPTELFEHEENCQYHAINCPGCDLPVGFFAYMTHFQEHHLGEAPKIAGCENTFLVTEDIAVYITDVDNELCKLSQMSAFGRSFFEVGVIIGGSIMYRWVYAHVSPDKAKQYQFSTVLQNENGREIAFTGSVFPLTKKWEHIIEEEGTFCTTFDMAGILADSNKKLNFTVTLRNLKDEAEDGENDISCNEECKSQ